VGRLVCAEKDLAMDFIPVSTPSITSGDVKAVAQVVESGWIASEGPHVREFEDKFSAVIGKKHGVAVSNGTAALDIALEALASGLGMTSSSPASPSFPV